MFQCLWLILPGFVVGTFGTLIGAGGGFILVPVLLLIYPDKSADTITSISLAVVFFNALSGSTAYARMRRIDFRSGSIFAIATIPGSILGSLTTTLIPRQIFNGIFGALLVLTAIYLFVRTKREQNAIEMDRKYSIIRRITDKEGKEYVFSYNPAKGIILSVFVGYISSLLGIGGGIIHVPAFVHLLNFPVHIATATSQFILAIMSFSGSMVHVFNGVLFTGLYQIVALSIGVIFGAQLGAKLSKFIHGNVIIRILAVTLELAGIRILLMAFNSSFLTPLHILMILAGVCFLSIAIWFVKKWIKVYHSNSKPDNMEAIENIYKEGT